MQRTPRCSEKLKIEIASDDFREGLTAVVSVKVMEPQFEGQTKTKLGNSEVTASVSQAVSDALRDYLEEHPRQAKMIVDKVILAATARHAAYNARKMYSANRHYVAEVFRKARRLLKPHG